MMSQVYARLAALVNNCDPASGSSGATCDTNLPEVSANAATVKIALQFLFGAVAVVMVIFIIIAAIRYQVALGNPEATAKLRKTIIYAAIGFAIALSAEAIVTFTIGRL